ncbi:MAG TPA: hypothetical protein VFO76_12915, partial [Candidatus Kapabacteria bacterium]|nr:hypothetical protein [Candidatus Kapabacteria bacterium]
MSTFSGSYTSLTSSGGTQLFTLNDDASSSFTAPFAFTYDTKNFSSGVTIGVSSNGFLAWGSTVSAVPNSSQYGWADGVAYAICPINSDLVSYVYYQTQGSAPNRKLVVEWYQYYIWPSSSTSMVQMQAYEGTNVIEFLYFNHSFNYSNSFGSDPPYIRIGLNGGTPSTDNKMYTVSGTSTPPTDLRFTPIPPINVQLGVT